MNSRREGKTRASKFLLSIGRGGLSLENAGLFFKAGLQRCLAVIQSGRGPYLFVKWLGAVSGVFKKKIQVVLLSAIKLVILFVIRKPSGVCLPCGVVSLVLLVFYFSFLLIRKWY